MSTVVKDLGAATAYGYAVEKGYTGTEAEFAELMADYAEVGQRAEDAADSALESKTAAQTAATTATNKASEATTAATTATNKAGEASTSASTATSAKDTAVSASQTATTKASEATTAAATATSAATTATTAKDDAVSAKTAAQTAQTGAETAAASVSASAAQIATNTEDIAQLKSDLTAKADVSELLKAFPVDTASGSIASFTDGAELPIKSLTVDIEPIQDLHGYDNPWPAGGGKNLLPVDTVYHDDSTEWIVIFSGEVTGTYTLSIDTSGVTSSVAPGAAVCSVTVDGTQRRDISINDKEATYTGTITQIGVFAANSYAQYRGTIKFQLEAGSTATSWTPYSNICPISGHTQAVVKRTGKNLINSSSYAFTTKTQNGLTYTVQSDGSIEVSGTATATGGPTLIETMELPNGTYSWNNAGYSQNHVKCSYRKKDKTTGATSALANPFTVDGTYEIYINLYCDATGSYNLTLYPQIEAGSTVTTYESYSGTSLTIPLGQTVYGGKLNVLSGELVIDRAMVTVTENDIIEYASNSNGFMFYCTNKSTGAKNNGAQICDRLSWAQGGSASSIYSAESGFVCYSNGVLYFKVNASIATVADMKAYLSSVGALQFCYELATPITIQLTPNQLNSLYGTNNLWADSGDSEVEYRANTKLWVQKKITEAVASLT